jgi:DNA ligase-1
MIKAIIDEIANEPSTNLKMVVLEKYKNNELLKRVLYLACSKRVKFYIRQIPDYKSLSTFQRSLEDALICLDGLSSRQFTGYAATVHLQNILNSVTENDAIIIERIIGKDLKMGMGRNINKVIPNLLETTPYLGCKPYKIDLVKKLFEKGKSCYGQVKMDGCYNNAVIRDGDVENESRQGEQVILTGSILVKELERFPDCVLNGEITINGMTNRLLANGIVGSMVDIAEKINTRTPEETAKKIVEFEKKNGCTHEEMLNRIQLTVWDMITPDEYYDQKSNRPYSDRLALLKEVVGKQNTTRIQVVETKELHCFEDALKYFQECLNRGLEGIIVKSLDGKWSSSKPASQIKMKLEMDVDLEIIGFNYGTKGTKNENVISSLQCKSLDGLLLSEPGGMSEEIMEYVTNNQTTLLGKIVHVKSCGICQDKLGNYSLLHPRVGEHKFRNDKVVADTLQEIKDNEDMCKGLVPTK